MNSDSAAERETPVTSSFMAFTWTPIRQAGGNAACQPHQAERQQQRETRCGGITPHNNLTLEFCTLHFHIRCIIWRLYNLPDNSLRTAEWATFLLKLYIYSTLKRAQYTMSIHQLLVTTTCCSGRFRGLPLAGKAETHVRNTGPTATWGKSIHKPRRTKGKSVSQGDQTTASHTINQSQSSNLGQSDIPGGLISGQRLSPLSTPGLISTKSETPRFPHWEPYFETLKFHHKFSLFPCFNLQNMRGRSRNLCPRGH